MARAQLIALLSALMLLAVVLDLVRRRRLREEYSWLWLAASVVYLLVAISPVISRGIGRVLGTSDVTAAFTFFGFFFVILILIQYSVRLSKLTTQVKDLSQHLAIVDSEQRELIETVSQTEEGAGPSEPVLRPVGQEQKESLDEGMNRPQPGLETMLAAGSAKVSS